MSISPASADLAEPRIYSRGFWLTFAANFTMVTACALTFRFAELTAFLGGTEQLTGEIVRAGMIGALASRLLLGQLLDRYGIRRIWMGNALLFAVSCLIFLACREISWSIYAARVCFATGVAGMSTASVVHIQNLVPRHRRTEVVGNFGSSGFIGMVIGSQTGDLIFYLVPGGQTRFQILFGLALLLSAAYVGLVWVITRNATHERPAKTPPMHRLIFRYSPGPIAMVALMMGVCLSVTTVFLTRMITERGLGGLGMFFMGYAATAFVFRVAASGWSRKVGRHRLVLLGLAGHVTGHLILSQATQWWHLLAAAVFSGFGHALLFPSVVSLGTERFPREYRGTGTSIILGFIEVGIAISAPILGWLIDSGIAQGLTDPFSQMLYATAATGTAIAVVYGTMTFHTRDETEIVRVQVRPPANRQPVAVAVTTEDPEPPVDRTAVATSRT